MDESEDIEVEQEGPGMDFLLKLTAGGKLLCKVLYATGPVTRGRPNLVSELIGEIVQGIEEAKDFSHIYPTLHRLVNNQEDRANLVSNLLVFDDYRRASEMLSLRNDLERDLITAAKNNQLRPAERIILLQMVDKRMSSIEHRIASKGSNIEDLNSILEKANYAVEMRGETLRSKFKESSPQGREIIRKLLTRIGRELKAAEA